MAENQFKSPLSKRGTYLEPDFHLFNPYTPDAILKEVYVPFDQASDGNFKSLEVNLELRHVYNDPSFNSDGIEILYRLLKVLVLDFRINNSWLEGENWKKVFESQLYNGQIKRANITCKFPSLKFDSAGEGRAEQVVEEEREDDNEMEMNAAVDFDEERNWNAFKLGPLSISEFDDSLLSPEGLGIDGILNMMKRDGIQRLKKILKVQLLEKHWFCSAAGLTQILFTEVYRRQFGSEVKASEESNDKTDEKLSNAADLQGLVPSILNQKKMLRKIIANEYSREYRSVSIEDIPDEEREIKLRHHKNLLFEFYFNNLFQIISQELERTEFVKFMFDFRIMLDQTTFAPLLFSLSPITKYSEFLTGAGESSKSILKQRAATQG
jgi:hypothetical protein